MKKHHRYNLIVLGVLTIGGLLVYGKTFFIGFFSDDYHILHVMMNGQPWWTYFATNIIGEMGNGTYGPLYNALIAFQLWLFGTQAWGYHVMSFVLYICVSFVLYLFTLHFTRNRMIAIVSACYFLLLHNHVSSVVWVSVQPHLGAIFMFMIGLYFYQNFVQQKIWWQYACAFVAIGCSLLFKESALLFMPVLFLYDVMFSNTVLVYRRVVHALLRMGPFILLVSIYLFVRHNIVGYVTGYYANTSLSLDIVEKLSRLVELTVDMVIAQPYRYHMMQFYDRHEILVWFILIVLTVITVTLAKEYRKHLLFLLVAYLVMSIPFLQVELHPLNNGAERYTLLISLFFVTYMSILVYALVHRYKRGVFYFGGTIVAVYISSLLQMYPKLTDWQVSAMVRERIIADIVQANIQGDNTYMLWVGLPDNIDGAEHMRNAIFEMIAIELGVELTGERIPIYTKFPSHVPFRKMIDVQFDDATMVLESQGWRIFTGFSTWQNDKATFDLVNFDVVGHTGTGIEVTFKDESRGKESVIGYFDGDHVRFISLR